jgi:hypothetical protein
VSDLCEAKENSEIALKGWHVTGRILGVRSKEKVLVVSSSAYYR